MIRKSLTIVSLLLFVLFALEVKGQLSAPGAIGSVETNYNTFEEVDSIFVFCADNEDAELGVLKASTALEGTKTFSWDKYNNATASFEFYFSESTDGMTSEIAGLGDGGYRVTVSQGATSQVYRAWVFNNWTTASVSISESNCEFFKLTGSFLSAEMNYYDLANNAELDVFKDMKVEWMQGEDIIAAVLSPQIYNPPTSDTDYTLRVYDRFGCESTTDVTYISIVTKAAFSADPTSGEAPLEVRFANNSENGDPDQFEWFFFRDLNEIKIESEATTEPIDSILVVAYDETPVYTYENTGSYMVKLVSKKISEFHTCVDTAYLEDYIVADSSFIQAPNVFTPNGDGTNDNFVVKFWSMQSIKISFFNRWGRKIHYWESDNIRGFENTYVETVWDGRLMGGKMASPGVYYYIVAGQGRDGEERTARGFFHLFRDKD